MTVLLGGRVAEEIVFGAVTTGASDDLQRVAEITHAMVHEYAMGTAHAGAPRARPTRTSSPTSRAASATRSSRSWPSRPSSAALAADHRPPRPSSRSSRRRCWPSEVLERPEIDRIMKGVPRLEHEPGRRRLRVAAASRHEPRPGDPARAATDRRPPPLDSGAACSPASTTSASPSRTSTRAGPLRADLRHGARAPRDGRPSRASRRCCSTSARTTSSCSRRSGPTRRSASSSPSAGPGIHHVAYQVTDIEAALAQLQGGGRRASSTRRRGSASAARASPSCTRRPPAACSPRSSSPRRDTETHGAAHQHRLPGQHAALPARERRRARRAHEGARRRRLARGRGRGRRRSG